MSHLIENVQVINARASSVIAHFCDSLKVVEHINDRVSLDSQRAEMSPGEAIKALVINLLVKREPLYRVREFYETMDIQNLFGKAWKADDFNDDRLGRALEKLAKSDLPGIYYAIAREALEKEGILLDQAHFDTTSLPVQGIYETAGSEESPLKIEFGHSKDRRPDLKQLMFGLGSVEGIPLFADVMNGNTSDKTWNGTMALRIKDLLPKEALHSMVTIADSAMVTEENLKIFGDRPFISRFPENFKLCKILKKQAFENEADWVQVGKLADKKNAASYRIQGISTELYGRNYRFAVVHSSALDQRKQKKIDRQVESEQAKAEKSIKDWSSVEYHCQEDAAAYLDECLNTPLKYHQITGQVIRRERIKRRPGRPSKTETAPVQTFYICEFSLIKDDARIQNERERESTFVLISNLSRDKEPGSLGLLRRYKAQIDVENLFRALKHPYFVHGVFLKNEARVLGLCYVLVIGLLLYALLQRRIRVKIAEEKTPLRLYGKDFYSPTGKTILEQFDYVNVIEYRDPVTGEKKTVANIPETTRLILIWLGLDETIYLDRRNTG
ncbi:IS1634 family transposase [Bacillus sp. V3-13]|uniref:IS1634 family transposase n=1 Tax=Bacillus sp. V3-13 TaxID=2053728 RepID=UPI0015E14AD7|nr:IS1634 family transposase [Bacillus sp. V3-13]